MGTTGNRPNTQEVRDIIDTMMSLSPYAAEVLGTIKERNILQAHTKAREVARTLISNNVLHGEQLAAVQRYLEKYPMIGRASKVNGEPLDQPHTFMATFSQAEQITMAAKRAGLARSTWMREAVLEKLAREVAS